MFLEVYHPGICFLLVSFVPHFLLFLGWTIPCISSTVAILLWTWFLKIFLNNFIYLFWAVLSLLCCTSFSLVEVSRGCSLVAMLGLLIAVASLGAEHGLWGVQASIVVKHGLSSCSPWALECCTIAVAHGLNALWRVQSSRIRNWTHDSHWQADSLPLSHQWSPNMHF